MQQIWTRIFRPYLEFMYLNNAYHFYAPDPSTSSYLWFRVIFTDDADGKEYGRWYKVPQLDEKGRILSVVGEAKKLALVVLKMAVGAIHPAERTRHKKRRRRTPAFRG